jgi:hypothetical protein
MFKNLPLDLKLEIYSFLPFISFMKILKNKEIFIALFNRNYPTISGAIADAIFTNILENCYMCNKNIDLQYFTNFCFKCSVIIEKDVQYHKICNKCFKTNNGFFNNNDNEKKISIKICNFCKKPCMYLKTSVYSY